MAEANSFSHIGGACVRVLARQAAIKLVKDELQRCGERVHSVPMRDIHIAANDYLAAHPELIPATVERVRNSPDYEHCLSAWAACARTLPTALDTDRSQAWALACEPCQGRGRECASIARS